MYILPCIPVNGTVILSGSARLPGMGLFIVLASGADRDKMPHYAAFYLGLHGLQISRLRKKIILTAFYSTLLKKLDE